MTTTTGSRGRARFWVMAVVTAGAVLLEVAPLIAQDGTSQTFEFAPLNRTYEAFINDLTPVLIGPASIALTSPDHTLTLRSHSATLTPLGDSTYRIVLTLFLGGRGTLDADVSMGAVKTRFTDELFVPAQTLELEGVVVITNDERGFVITTRELPAEISVRIESQLAGRLFRVCHQMVLVLVNLDCPALEASLTNIRAPLPPAGESYLLSYEELTTQERRALEVFLLR